MEDKQVKVEQVSVDDANVTASQDATPETESKQDEHVAELETALADVNDKYLRAMAELENTRRRAAIDSEARARTRVVSVLEKILPVMDAVDAALKHAPTDEGIKSLAKALKSSFDTLGITRMETVGTPLDPTKHNAIQVVAASENTAPNTIVEELQPGYMLGDTVLRTAMVIVAK